MALVEAAVDLAEWPHRDVDLVGRHAAAGVGDEDLDEAVGRCPGGAMDASALGVCRIRMESNVGGFESTPLVAV